MEQDVLVPWHLSKSKDHEEKVYQRYYHMFQKGELERLFESAGARILDNGYDRDNWWAVGSRV